MKLVLKNSKLIALFLLAIIYVGCSEDVVELPKMTAGFTYTLNENTGTVEFINISENATTYSWDFGDEVPVVPASTSLEVNPIKSYTNGTYTVILKAMNSAGAISYFEDIIVINMPLPLGLPITFDNDNVNYSATAFEGVAYEIVENPAPGGSNDVASMVAAITNSGAAYEGLFFELESAIDLSTNNTIKMNFWSDAAVSMLLKLEEGTAFTEVSASHAGAGWEELQFTFTKIASYSKLVVFVDGAGTTAGTFYMDDIVQVSLGDAPVITLIGDATISLTKGTAYTEQGATASDTEDGDVTSAIVIGGDTVDVDTLAIYEVTYTVVDSDGNTTTAVRSIEVSLGDVPVVTLIGAASISLTQGDTYAEQGATASDTEDGDISSAIVIAGDTVDTNTPGTYAVTYTVTDADGNTTVASRNVEVNAADACDADETQSVSAADLNVTMGSAVTIIEDGTTFEIIDNPDFDNTINTSCKVGKVTKQGVAAWDNIQLDLNAKLDFNSNSGLKIKVWSARANTTVLLKLEEIGNPGNSLELGSMTTSVTSGWEELTYPVGSGESNKFNKVVVFFDLDGGNTDTYYFDDLKLYGDGSGTGTGGGSSNTVGGGDGCADTTTCPDAPAGELLFNGDFEACDCDWQLLDAVGSTISTSINNGGSKSGQIQGSAGVAVGLKQERLGVGTIQPNTTYIVTYDIKASGAFGEGGVFKAFTFSEPAEGTDSGATQHILTDGTTSMSSNWESKSYEFTTPGTAAQVAGGLSFLIEIVNSTANAAINIDNVVLKIK
tara:strand:- start:360 stop:2696 length:2337 start_codon:yes stop_codon:yes gene_type:complete